jgi:predicted outer membrane protein
MRIIMTIAILLLAAVPGSAQDQLTSPYRQQAAAGLRGLDEREIAELKAGAGMRLARAAELNSYPGPRHVLDAIEAGKLAASSEQRERVQQVFNAMSSDAVKVGTQILEEEQNLETGFRTATMTQSDLHARVARIAALQGELRAIHLAAHLDPRDTLRVADRPLQRASRLHGECDQASERTAQALIPGTSQCDPSESQRVCDN